MAWGTLGSVIEGQQNKKLHKQGSVLLSFLAQHFRANVSGQLS